MKKSKIINLVLITCTLASCHKAQTSEEWKNENRKHVYMRGDTTASYCRNNNDFWLWYYAFRPYGYYNGNTYIRSGYYSDAISQQANIGTNSFKSSVVRGGFGDGGHGFSVSS
jgi:hypothetical protein